MVGYSITYLLEHFAPASYGDMIGEGINSPDPGSDNLASMTTGTGANSKAPVTAAARADTEATYYRPPRRRQTSWSPPRGWCLLRP